MDKLFSYNCQLSKNFHALQQTLTQQTSANYSNLWPGCDKLYIEFNAFKQTLVQQTSA
jgi:hypothetical protein